MSDKEEKTGARARLEEAEVALKRHPTKLTRLSDFLDSFEKTSRLTKEDRLRIIEQALLLLEMNYVHLPLKRAMHAIDPIQRLKLLKFRLTEMEESELPPEIVFHRRILEVFASTRDLHTLYLLPAPFRDRVAYLPFLIEQYFEGGNKGERVERFMVSRTVTEFYQSIQSPGPEVLAFVPGVEVLYWNGVPIKRAIEINGETQAGSNPEARFARGLDNLTIRPLETSLPPDERWVDITYLSHSGKELTLRQEWLVYLTSSAEPTEMPARSSRKKRAAIDIKKTKINHMRRKLFGPHEVQIGSAFKDIFYSEVRKVDGGEIGYIRLFSFEVDDPAEFVNEFNRVIKSDGFPQNGLIIDVRGNGGGEIKAGERLLQLFSPRRIKPEPFEFINTSLNLEICRLAPKEWNLSRWVDSIAEAVTTGATYSSGFPLTSEASCNEIGQTYYGPVVLVTDALSYSATDIFSAGFQDNEIGEVLGASDNTGAGGANVWRYEILMNVVGNLRNSPFKPLPRGADLAVAIRRSIRVGKLAGRPLEELGITPDRRHYMTRRDVLGRNEDLIAQAARILNKKPYYCLLVKPFKSENGSRGVIVTAHSKIQPGDKTKNIARLDVYLDERPYQSFDVKNGSIEELKITVDRLRKANELRIEAYDRSNTLVAVHRSPFSTRRASPTSSESRGHRPTGGK
jgi:hypothetical protein